MRNILKKFLIPSLIIITLFLSIIALGIALFYTGITNIGPSELIILCACFSGTSLIILLIFLMGTEKEGKEGAMYSMVAVSVKLLIEMVIALLWFIPAKKTGLEYILLFFVLYLAFSLCSVFIILNILKKKSL